MSDINLMLPLFQARMDNNYYCEFFTDKEGFIVIEHAALCAIYIKYQERAVKNISVSYSLRMVIIF